jgi:hypothetical protein
MSFATYETEFERNLCPRLHARGVAVDYLYHEPGTLWCLDYRHRVWCLHQEVTRSNVDDRGCDDLALA